MKKTNAARRIDKLSSFLHAYEFIKKCTLEKKNLTDYPADDETKIFKSFTDIRVTVKTLMKKGWINRESSILKELDKAREALLEKLSFEIFISPRSDELRFYGYWKNKRQDFCSTEKGIKKKVVRQQGRPSDDAFNLLLWLIGNNEKGLKGDKFWLDVTKIFEDNNIPLSEKKDAGHQESLNAQFMRLRKKDIKALYNEYRARSARLKPNPRGAGFTMFFLLPTWEEIIS